ncbi:MAG: L-histidine N(alpha)-methyltransferase [Planctomycetota bacterium]
MPTHDSSSSSSTQPLEAATEGRLQRIWQRAYTARTQEDLLRLYADWSATYDQDHEAIGFFGHELAAAMLARYTPFRRSAAVLDAGAGTGAAGTALHALGYRNLVGVDISSPMLAKAKQKGVYRDLRAADLGQPVDAFPDSSFDAAILVGVFSFGQAPAYTLDEVVRLVRPGGVVVFTMRVDFFEQDAMGVRSRMDEFDARHVWKLLDRTEPAPYLPHKEPDAMFRVFAYRVLETKEPPVDESFAAAAREALTGDEPVRRIDHAFIWDSTASRLYDRYTECEGYYLTDCELEILESHGREILGEDRLVVELGCGSARKVRHLVDAALQRGDGSRLVYTPVDISAGAVQATKDELDRAYQDRVDVQPRVGRFDSVLSSIPVDDGKLIVFFGSSLGNIESMDGTLDFLRMVRDRMTVGDRFVVGLDLDKDDDVLRGAYEAGPRNRDFFLHMVRRINHVLAGNFDLDAFRQHSPILREPEFAGVKPRSVHLRLVTERPQDAYLARLHMEAHLDGGDAIQVGISRKFEKGQVAVLAEAAGLRLQRQWCDRRGWFSLNELVRDDAAPRP